MMPQGSFIYSNYNTFPTYGTNNITGVRIDDLLTAAGLDIGSLTPNRLIRFVSGDGSGYSSVVTWGQISEDRYYFGQNGMQGAPVPAIIGFSSVDPGEGNLPRNFFGQAAAGEQTRNSFVRSAARIEILENAGAWGSAAASPVSGTQVAAGDLIRLSTPSAYPAEAKIYYTLDGSEPDMLSPMYNPSTYQPELNVPIPIIEPTVIKVKAYGYGKADSETAVFTFIPEE